MMRTYFRSRLTPGDERGATVIIVVLSIFAIFGMVVLTVDVGGLVFRKRSMVNAADAGALSAAQTCSQPLDTTDPATSANSYANQNDSGLKASGNPIVANQNCFQGMSTADKKTKGWVTVQYTAQQQLFFAGVLGFGNKSPVTSAATAAWGTAAAGYAVPIVLESGQLQGVCKVPDGVKVGDTCAFWYDNNTLGAADWGFMNLDKWNVTPGANCSNAGSSSRSNWIVNGYGTSLPLNGTPAGASPTYVCTDTGHSTRDWQDLFDQRGQIKTFPVNDCSGQLNKSGTVAPCPATPDKYDIIGFTRLLVKEVYKGNDSAAIGTAGLNGNCNNKSLPAGLVTGQTLDLAAFATANCGAPAKVDNIPFASVVVTDGAKKNPKTYVGCKTGLGLPACSGNWDYSYNETTKILTWHHAASTTEKISFNWSTNGTPGVCPGHSSDPNAICMVTEWRGFTNSDGPICDTCTNFGAINIILCDRTLKTCPGQ